MSNNLTVTGTCGIAEKDIIIGHTYQLLFDLSIIEQDVTTSDHLFYSLESKNLIKIYDKTAVVRGVADCRTDEGVLFNLIDAKGKAILKDDEEQSPCSVVCKRFAINSVWCCRNL